MNTASKKQALATFVIMLAMQISMFIVVLNYFNTTIDDLNFILFTSQLFFFPIFYFIIISYKNVFTYKGARPFYKFFSRFFLLEIAFAMYTLITNDIINGEMLIMLAGIRILSGTTMSQSESIAVLFNSSNKNILKLIDSIRNGSASDKNSHQDLLDYAKENEEYGILLDYYEATSNYTAIYDFCLIHERWQEAIESAKKLKNHSNVYELYEEKLKDFKSAAEYAEEIKDQLHAARNYFKLQNWQKAIENFEKVSYKVKTKEDHTKVYKIYEDKLKDLKSAEEYAVQNKDLNRILDYNIKLENFEKAINSAKELKNHDKVYELYETKLKDLKSAAEYATEIEDWENAAKYFDEQNNWLDSVKIYKIMKNHDKVYELYETKLKDLKSAAKYAKEVNNWNKALSYYLSLEEWENVVNIAKKLTKQSLVYKIYETKLKDFKSAAEYAEKVKNWKQAAKFYLKIKDWKNAVKIYKILKDHSKVYELYENKLNDFNNAAEYAEKIKDWESVFKFYMLLKNWQKALEIAKTLNDENKIFNIYVENLEDYKSAEKYAKNTEQYNILAKKYEEVQNYKKAQEFYNKISNKEKELDMLEKLENYQRAGILSLELKYFDKSIKYLKKHLEKNNSDTETHLILADAYIENEMYQEATSHLQRSDKLESKKNLITCFNKIEEFTLAYNILKEIVIKDEKDKDFIYTNLKVFAENNKYQEAIESLNKIATVDYNYRDIQDLLKSYSKKNGSSLSISQAMEGTMIAETMVDESLPSIQV